MNDGLGAVCDEFYVNSRLALKLDMALERETVLHFFDRLRRQYPALAKLRRRGDSCLLLEEDDAAGKDAHRWVRLDRRSLRFGQCAPNDTSDVRQFADLILNQAPYHLSFSEIDFDHLALAYGYDLEYCGNHDQLVAETFCSDQRGASFLFGRETAHIIDAQPYFGIALSRQCDLQAYVEIKSRTTTYEVRNDAYESEPISVLFTLRKYWGVGQSLSLTDTLGTLFDTADELAAETIIPAFVNPLAAAIASQP
ncbi:MAG: hypothetical protein ACE5HE_05370 [Phycisphaerae bacterium]